MSTRHRLFFAFLLTCSWSQLSAEKPQAWGILFFPIGDFKNTEFSLWQEYRFTLPSLLLVNNRCSLNAKRQLLDCLNGEVHYTYIFSHKSHETTTSQTRRLELELNPHFKFTNNIELKLRNRYEFLNRDEQPKHIERFRQRHQLLWKVTGRAFNSISIHNELFYNVNIKTIDQIRFVPVELGFKLGKRANYKTFCMIRWQKSSDLWRSHFVWGLSLAF